MSHRTTVPVTWGDTDAGGLLYFPRLFHWFVVGLNDYLSPAFEGAHPMESLRARGRTLPVVEAEASFSAPLRAGDAAGIETTVRTTGETSFTAGFAVERAADGRGAAEGAATFVLVDERFEPTPLPEAVLDCIRERGDALAGR